MPQTKIVATLGPATDRESIIRSMFRYGLDVVRLNFSHGDIKTHAARVDLVRRLNRKMRRSVRIMQDLEGFRIRIGRLKKDILLKRRQVIYLVQKDIVGTEKEVGFDYRGSLKGVSRGNLIYIDDGKIILKVLKSEKGRIKTEVIVGGILKEKKGLNIQGAKFKFPHLTPKDKEDVKFAIHHKLDYVAQSFVRNAADVVALKEIIRPYLPSCKIFAKIESAESLKNIDEIIDESDGIMVARGDLGISVPIAHVPVIQKEIIRKCRRAAKPVIVATQMLESMTHELMPTRAEVTDVANAILDGANYLMLSAETAVGMHPHKVVEMMNDIIKYTEKYQRNLDAFLA